MYDNIPSGFHEIKNVTAIYKKGYEIVICGIPDENDENHNCDYMGCSSVSHVLYRGYCPVERIGYKAGGEA